MMVIEVKGRDKYNEKIAEKFRSERTQKPHREKVNEPLSEGPQRSSLASCVSIPGVLLGK